MNAQSHPQSYPRSISTPEEAKAVLRALGSAGVGAGAHYHNLTKVAGTPSVSTTTSNSSSSAHQNQQQAPTTPVRCTNDSRDGSRSGSSSSRGASSESSSVHFNSPASPTIILPSQCDQYNDQYNIQSDQRKNSQSSPPLTMTELTLAQARQREEIQLLVLALDTLIPPSKLNKLKAEQHLHELKKHGSNQKTGGAAGPVGM